MFGRVCSKLALLRTGGYLQGSSALAGQEPLAALTARQLLSTAAPAGTTSPEAEAVSKTFSRQKSASNNAPAAPWTPTDQLKKRKHLTKRMGHLIQVLEKEEMEANTNVKTFPRFAAGDFLEIKTAVPENQRREAIFKGLCIARTWRGLRSTFTVRNFITGGGGIERTFQLYTPHILQIKVIRSMRTRRAKLYYLRKRQPREYRI